MASVRQYVSEYVLMYIHTYVHKYVSTYLLPRDYAWMTAQNHDTEADVIVAAATIHFNDDLDEATTKEELDSLATAANKNETEITAKRHRSHTARFTSTNPGFSNFTSGASLGALPTISAIS